MSFGQDAGGQSKGVHRCRTSPAAARNRRCRRARRAGAVANAESFEDVTVSIPFHRQVTVIEDSDGTGNWRVEYFDDDGACYVSSPVLKPRSVLATISRRSSSGGCEPSGLVSSA